MCGGRAIAVPNKPTPQPGGRLRGAGCAPTIQGGECTLKIESYQVRASASHSKTEMDYTSIVRSDGRQQNGLPGAISLLGGSGDQLSLSGTAREQLAGLRAGISSASSGANGTTAVSGVENLPQSKEEMKLRLLEQFMSRISGRKVSLSMSGLFSGDRLMVRPLAAFRTGQTGFAQLTATHVRYESEQVGYNAKGVVKTADGKTIHVDVSMHMSREFAEYSQTSLGWQPAGNLCDPLVINYGGTAASLTGEKYDFDLDGDGVLDKISFAGAGSGFLALDKNGDGTINDGSELFGPGTGNGFGELRAYDKDGNGWIDENDAVFSQLRIWSKDQNGKDQLFTLRELGIGAIYLGDVATEYTMKDGAGSTQGVMRSTSFFLRENGGAGTVSHIDLLV